MPYNSFDDYPMSWKPALDRSSRSLYQALARRLEEDIASGVLKPGTRLPPQRELADFLDINVSTVAKAFKQCELRGLLTASVGSGTFVAYSALTDQEFLHPANRQGLIDMAQALPDPSAQEPLFDMARDLLSRGGANLFGFRSQEAVEWQKDAAVSLMKQCGHPASRSQILFANGAQNALSALLPALFRRGSKIAVDDHTYPGVKSAAAMFGVKLVPVATGPCGMDPGSLERICRSEKISGLFLLSACHTPTTATLPLERRQQIADIARRHDLLLIEDGAYHLLHPGMPSVSSLAPERSAYIATLSKVIAPGLRTAFIAVPQAVRESVSEALYSLNLTVVPLMAELSCRVVVSNQFGSILERHRLCISRRAAVVREYLPDSLCLGSGRDMCRWLQLPREEDSLRFERQCLERGLLVRAACRFAVGKTPPARAVHLGICTPQSETELRKGLSILKELLEE